jgi:hypothetical protein
MKIRIALGLDLDAYPLESHELMLREAVKDMSSFRGLEVTLRIVNATAVLEVTDPRRPQLPPFHHLFSDLPQLNIYRWVNISKET